VPLEEEALQVVSTESDPLERVQKLEKAERLTRAINKLPETERMATRMFYYEHLSHAEIADRLHIPAKTLKSRLHAARGRLRQTPTLDRLAIPRPLLVVASSSPSSQLVALPDKKKAVSMAA